MLSVTVVASDRKFHLGLVIGARRNAAYYHCTFFAASLNYRLVCSRGNDANKLSRRLNHGPVLQKFPNVRTNENSN